MKTGIAVFKHKQAGVFAFGALCALEEIGFQTDYICTSPDSALCGVLFQKGYSLEEGKRLYCAYFSQEKSGRNKLWETLLKGPNQRGSLLICQGGQIYTKQDEEHKLFGNNPYRLEDFVLSELNNNEQESNCNREQLFWVLNTMGAERVISLEGEQDKYQKLIGKNPAFTLVQSDLLDILSGGEWQDALNDGFEQMMKRKNEVLNAIYFAGKY